MLEEDRFIERFFAPLSPQAGAYNLKDDVAVLSPAAGSRFVITSDTVVEGVHFFGEDKPAHIAQKSLRVNLSDLAAKGARPQAYFLNLSLPFKRDESFMEGFVEGLAQDQEEFGILLYGGDTVRVNGPLTITITAVGVAPAQKDLYRGNGRDGDILVVTGTLGDAALGLLLRRNAALAETWGLGVADKRDLRMRFLLPQPRLAAGAALRAHARAALDVSDGLIADCARLARASGLGGALQREALPLSEAARKAVRADESLWESIVAGGDDYEILAAVPPDRVKPLLADLRAVGLTGHVVGALYAGEAGEVRLFDSHGEPLPLARQGYSHI